MAYVIISHIFLGIMRRRPSPYNHRERFCFTLLTKSIVVKIEICTEAKDDGRISVLYNKKKRGIARKHPARDLHVQSWCRFFKRSQKVDIT